MAAALCCRPAAAQDASSTIPPSAVIGVQEAMLSPDYWIGRAHAVDDVLMTPAQIAARNRLTSVHDQALVDLESLPTTLTREQIQGWVKSAASPLNAPLVDMHGDPLTAQTLAAIQANVGMQQIPASEPARYGMAVRRAQLRTYPTTVRAFASKESVDFESFEGGTLFPGDPVVIAKASVDGKWLLVVSYQGPAWVATTDIAEGSAQAVFGYAQKSPARVITGDEVRTVFTPEAPEVSELQLDMGTRLPLAKVPPDQPVNGQGPYESWALELPVRGNDGALSFKPALLQKMRDSAPDYLPLSRANIIRQAFKFLGERYGWGHAYNARDCSGFTSDVYRSMGVLMPPNANAQGKSPAFAHRLFTAADSHAARIDAIMHADVGDLIVVPGHVLMLLGQVDGQPYVIQDVPFVIYRNPQGGVHWTKVNEVSVTPLLPLLADGKQSYVDAMTSLVHVTASSTPADK
ncbi:SH3 domain-containing protein [Dyella acidiphila]|nr:SH3 domain-containing protein [Dyella acidiphila]